MNTAQLQTFCQIAYERAGIKLTAEKQPLVTARVAKRLRALGISSEREYLNLLRSAEGAEEIVNFVDAISTNFTSFFREEAHFELLSEQMARWLSEGRRRLRFWCAASSTGEEPYTLAMVLAEAFAGLDVDYRILATDISTRALSAAREGAYGEAQVGRVPGYLRLRYFSRPPRHGAETVYRVQPELQKRIVFARLNLAAPPFPMAGPVDVVMCRNVMIYFDQAVRQRLLAEIERILSPGGLLLIGHSETLNGLASDLRAIRPSVYLKSGGHEADPARRVRA